MADVLGGFEHKVLLAIMRLGSSGYSVPIVRELEQRTDRSVAPAAVYVTLRRLETRGLLVSRMEPPADGVGGRARRVFDARQCKTQKKQRKHIIKLLRMLGLGLVLIDPQRKSKNVEVLNAGIGSYSPTIYYVKTLHMLNQLKIDFDHMVICLDISDIQDEAGTYEIDDGVVTAKQDSVLKKTKMFLHDYTTIGRLIQHYSVKIASRFTGPHSETLRTKREKDLSIGKIRSSWTIHKDIYEEYGKDGLTKSKKHLNLLFELLSDNDISLTLVVYPWPDQIINNDFHSS